jgi:hypothetical protein
VDHSTPPQYLDKFIVTYLDDILIYSKTRKEHIQHVSAVLEVLGKTGIRINGEKSIFYTAEVEFLGFIITQNGIKIDLKKMEVVTN